MSEFESLEDVYGNMVDTVDIKIAGATFKCKQCDQNSVEWAKEVRRQTKAYRGLLRGGGQLSAEKDREIVIAVFVEVCLVGWSNLRLKKDDATLDFTKPMAVRLFTDYPRLFTDLMAEAADMNRYREDEVKVQTGN